jgi:hypothetical protein
MAFSNELLDQLLAGCERPEDILGPPGLFAQLKKAFAERALGAPSSGIPWLRKPKPHLPSAAGAAIIATAARPRRCSPTRGAVTVAIPRDRAGTFEPQLSPNHQRPQPSAAAAGLRGQGSGALRPRAHGGGNASAPRRALRRRRLPGTDQHGDRCGAGGGHRVAAAALGPALPGNRLRRAPAADPRRGDGAGEAVDRALGIAPDGTNRAEARARSRGAGSSHPVGTAMAPRSYRWRWRQWCPAGLWWYRALPVSLWCPPALERRPFSLRWHQSRPR